MAQMQTIVPMLAYEDGPAAMDWLINAFGLVEKERWLDEEGRLTHGELLAGDAIVMLAMPTPDYESPKRHREHCAAAQLWSQTPYILNGVLIYVNDIEAHYARAVQAGATILSPIEESFPGKRYRAEDLEGQRWFFMER